MRLTLIFMPAMAALAACSAQSPDDAQVGGLTSGELEQLESAADRVDARAPSPAAADAAGIEAQSRAELEAQRADSRNR